SGMHSVLPSSRLSASESRDPYSPRPPTGEPCGQRPPLMSSGDKDMELLGCSDCCWGVCFEREAKNEEISCALCSDHIHSRHNRLAGVSSESQAPSCGTGSGYRQTQLV